MTDYKKLCEDLRYCAVGEHDCEKCDYREKDDGGAECINSIVFDAASAIEELQAKNKHLNDLLDSALKDMETAQAENERLKKQLEGAIKDIKLMLDTQRVCFACANYVKCKSRATDDRCYCASKWRGEEEKA